jgi:hypothetical protein
MKCVARFQSDLEFDQMFRTGFINGAQGIKGAPVALAVAETSEITIRIALFELLAPENISKG